ncbi:MAG: hypothetical protein ACREDR_29555 [Blastocatellia bacterium]
MDFRSLYGIEELKRISGQRGPEFGERFATMASISAITLTVSPQRFVASSHS